MLFQLPTIGAARSKGRVSVIIKQIPYEMCREELRELLDDNRHAAETTVVGCDAGRIFSDAHRQSSINTLPRMSPALRIILHPVKSLQLIPIPGEVESVLKNSILLFRARPHARLSRDMISMLTALSSFGT